MPALIIIAVLILIVLILLITNIKIVPQSMVFVVERLGAYQQTWETGLHFKVPFIDHIAKRVSLKEQVVDFKPQPVITRDNVTMQIDSVVFYQITDAKLFTYGVERPISAIENLTATTLRNIIGELELDHTLTSRDVINTKITTTLDTATDKWGIKVNRVELKNILPPAEIQDAMEKQMKAERQRRESILRAEGQKQERHDRRSAHRRALLSHHRGLPADAAHQRPGVLRRSPHLLSGHGGADDAGEKIQDSLVSELYHGRHPDRRHGFLPDLGTGTGIIRQQKGDLQNG